MNITFVRTISRRVLVSLAAFILLAVPTASRASVITSGNFKTGTPTPTLSITTPVSFNINLADATNAQVFAFDEWVTYDSNLSSVTANGLLNYQINGGAPQSVVTNFLVDNYGINLSNGFTPNDGYLYFFATIPVTLGQTVTILPSTFTFSGANANFNQPPALFNGNAYLVDTRGNRVSDIVSVNTVPEPSTWAFFIAAAGLLSLYLLRLHCVS